MYCFSHCNFKYRFKYRQNAPFTGLVFIFSAIVLNTVTMHNFTCTIHVFNFFSAVPNCFQYCQNACFRDIVFKKFSAVQNCFNYRHNACFRDICFHFFSAVPIRFKYRHSACFTDIAFIFSLQFQIPSQCML